MHRLKPNQQERGRSYPWLDSTIFAEFFMHTRWQLPICSFSGLARAAENWHSTKVSKPALGRGLGNLMPSQKGAQAPSQPSLPGIISPGMAALLKADKPGTAEKTETLGVRLEDPPQQHRLPSTVRLSMFGADFLLCALVAGYVFIHPGPVGTWETVLCLAAIFLGAWLSVLALWLD